MNEGTNYWESQPAVRRPGWVPKRVGRVGGRSSMDRLSELKTIVIDLG